VRVRMQALCIFAAVRVESSGGEAAREMLMPRYLMGEEEMIGFTRVIVVVCTCHW